MNESSEAKEIISNKVGIPVDDADTVCVVFEVSSNTTEPSYADIEIKNDGNILGKTRIKLFA